jgi:hypothetical protein
MVVLVKFNSGQVFGAFTSVVWNFAGPFTNWACMQYDPNAVIFYKSSPFQALDRYNLTASQVAVFQGPNCLYLGGYIQINWNISTPPGVTVGTTKDGGIVPKTFPPLILQTPLELEIWSLV